jgi:hypothetical protein
METSKWKRTSVLTRSVTISIGSIVLIVLCCCSTKSRSGAADSDEGIKLKLDQVLHEMNRRVDDPAEKATLAQATPFINIKDLNMDFVGFAMPSGDKHNRIHVSSTLENFQNNDVETLAREALNNWRLASRETPPER